MTHIRGSRPDAREPTMPKIESKKTDEDLAGKKRKKPRKITEPMREALLKRPLKPSVTYDSEVSRFALIVTMERGFWALFYQPRGTNPATGKRWGGGVRHELGDAMIMTVDEARTEAMIAKALVRQGRSPHHEAMAARASAVAQRAILPSRADEALSAYAPALMARRQPSEYTRRKYIHYATKAIRLMKAGPLALAALEPAMARVMLETMAGSEGERHLVFRGLDRFLTWCVKQGLVERNICDDLDRDEKPRGAQSRDHVPTIDELRAVRNAVENEPQRDMIQFFVLVPLRRDEIAGLTWSEIDLSQKRIRIRMKTHEIHELPLSTPALALLEARKATATGELVFPAANDKPYNGFHTLINRIRAKIGKSSAPKAQRFTWHDIRRAFVSHLAERGFDVDLLDQCLGHSRKGVFGIYQRASRMAERARALETWSNLVTGAGEESGRVVAFRAK
jgi:integrase